MATTHRQWRMVSRLACAAVVFSASSVLWPGSVVHAQTASPGAIQGRVWDEEGAPVAGVLVRLFHQGQQGSRRGAETDDLGHYHMEPIAPGVYRLEIARLGFAREAREVTVQPGRRSNVDFTLRAAAIEVEGISVEAERSRQRANFEEEAGVTVRELVGAEIKAIPGLVEADPLRAVEVLPGVITTSDFSSAFNVRGGSADQNLILLDGLPIFNPSHLGGFFSVFNGDMISRAELRSGGFPARFGGRVSSVLDVQTDAGDGRFQADGGVSLLATRMALGGGLPTSWRDRVGLRNAQWRVSGRRSYFDQLLKPALDFPYHLTDFQGVFRGWTRGGNRVSISGYTGRDVLNLANLDPDDFPLRVNWDWGNDVIGGSWTHPGRDGGWLELRGGFSRFSSGLAFPDFDDTELRSLIEQASLEADWEVRPTAYLTLTSGTGLRRLRDDNLVATGGTEFAGGAGRGTELFAYAQAEWKPNSSWIVEVGGRLDRWSPARGDLVWVVSPRLSAKRFLAGSQWALKASAGRYTQFLHSIRDEELPLGLDVWVLAGEQAPHLISDQIQAGLEGFPREGWFLSAEAYLRDFDGVTTTNFADDPNDDTDDYLGGTGDSYGLDVLLQKSTGSTTGWLALSWLRTTRSFPDFASGLVPAPEITYPPIFDRRLDVDLVLQRDLGRGFEAGLRWNFGTGLPFTQPLGSYAYLSPRLVPGSGLEWRDGEDDDEEGNYGVVLSDRNGARYPARHRLDVSLRWRLQRSWGQMTPYLNILNLYDQRNVLFYFYQFEKDPPVRAGVSMFPFLPTLGLEISF